MTLIEHLKQFLPSENIFIEEPLALHTSFRVGGPAEIFITPKTTEELVKIWEISRSKNIPLTILGDGTNVLVSDTGLQGIIVTTSKINKIEVLASGRITAQTGAKLAKVAEVACKAGLAGFEFVSGIPGTVGGAVYMNAGAYDHEIGEFCESVTLVSNSVITKQGSEMGFGYRKSCVQTGDTLVLEATFQLAPGNEDEIRAKMKELNNRRRQSQPLDFPSAGSTFKRPIGMFAGKLIQDSGLKGFTIGGAQVSEKHAGFVVNTGNATAQDIFDLIQAVRNRVYENFNVWLEPEVKILGFA